jgi:hypothetical protein
MSTTASNSTKNSDFALLPVTKNQKHIYNFTSLNKTYNEFVNVIAKKLVENNGNLNNEVIEKIFNETAQQVYHHTDVKEKKKTGTKQAPNAYILFCVEQRPIVKEDNPELKPTEITSKLSKMWHELTDEEKEPYVTESKRLNDALKTKKTEETETETETEVDEEEVKLVKKKAAPAKKAEPVKKSEPAKKTKTVVEIETESETENTEEEEEKPVKKSSGKSKSNNEKQVSKKK